MDRGNLWMCKVCARCVLCVSVNGWMDVFSFKRNHLLFYRKIIEMKVYKNWNQLPNQWPCTLFTRHRFYSIFIKYSHHRFVSYLYIQFPINVLIESISKMIANLLHVLACDSIFAYVWLFIMPNRKPIANILKPTVNMMSSGLSKLEIHSGQALHKCWLRAAKIKSIYISNMNLELIYFQLHHSQLEVPTNADTHIHKDILKPNCFP